MLQKQVVASLSVLILINFSPGPDGLHQSTRPLGQIRQETEVIMKDITFFIRRH